MKGTSEACRIQLKSYHVLNPDILSCQPRKFLTVRLHQIPTRGYFG